MKVNLSRLPACFAAIVFRPLGNIATIRLLNWPLLLLLFLTPFVSFTQPPVVNGDCGRPTLFFNSATNVSTTISALSEPTQGSGTWEAWVRKEDWSSYSTDEKLFANNYDYPHESAFYISLHGVVGFHFRTGYTNGAYVANNSTFGFPANSWHHLAATWSESAGTVTITIYIDGIASGTNTSTSVFDIGTNFYLGGKDGSYKLQNGEMMEVRVWDVARTESEIAASMNNLLIGDESGLVSYWPLDETSGSTTALNKVSGGADGIIANLDASADRRNYPLEIKEAGNLVLSGTTYDFGIQYTNASSVAKVFTITNQGAATIDLSANPISALTGINADEFELDLSSTATSLTGGASTTFSVTFSPTSEGVKNALFSFANVSGCSDPYTINLTGLGNSLQVSINIDTEISIYGETTGQLTVTATGGTAPYTYAWSNGATTATISDLAAGTYTVTVTDDNGYMKQTSEELTQPDKLKAYVTKDAYLVTSDGSEGALTVVATGGVEPYTYLWSNGETTASITGLTQGEYTVTVTDANEAVAVDQATVAMYRPFITTWKTDNPGSSNSQSIIIRTEGTGYNYTVYWEEVGNEANNNAGAEITFNDSNTPHTIDFGAPGTYRVEISGDFPRIYFAAIGGDRRKILTVEQWGDIAWQSMNAAFRGCSNLTMAATDAPDLAQVTDMSRMFYNATSFDGDLSTWDVSSVTDMESMFQGATSFNGDLGTWDVSSVTDMSLMFYNAASFNGDLSAWDVSSVTDMSGMFGDATSFNGDLSAWDVSSVTAMEVMFSGATSFNGDLSAWDVNSVTNMIGMFQNATSFNGDLGTWDVSSVTNIYSMFRGATSFNGDLSAWDVTSVTNMNQMFQYATSFNGDVSTWDVGSVTNMSYMFRGAISFNGDLSAWDVSSVTNMSEMFYEATSFNGDVSAWDVNSVANMSYMFYEATSFDQNLGAWDISKVTNMSHMLENTGLSTKNYDATLIGWATLDAGETQIPLNRSPYPTGLTYCHAVAARATLVSTYNWSLYGDTQECLPFITTWQTTTAAESITIPTTGAGYGYTVDWGDGTTDETIYTDDASHEYAAAGTYTVTISGDFPRIYFNNGGDKDKILSVAQWGTQIWTSMEQAFYGCGNLTLTATDAPNLDQVTNMSNMFASASAFNGDISSWDVDNVQNMSGVFSDASSFNQPIGNWDVRNVADMSFMFNNASAFDQPIGGWDISQVTNMNSMLKSAGLSTAHYDATLVGWATLDTDKGETQIPTGITLHSDDLIYSCEGALARTSLIDTYNWFVSGDAVLKCNQTITFEPIAVKTYGDAPFDLSATSSSGLTVTYFCSNETVASISGNTVTIIGAGTATITAIQDGNENYLEADLVDQVLTVNKATAQITITDLEQETDGSAKEPTIVTNPGELNFSITYDGATDAPSDAGSYEVVVTINENNYQGTATATFILNNVTGIISTKSNGLLLYPNPATESFELKSVRDEQINVLDLSGKLLLQSRTNTMTDISMLKNGVYLVELSGNSILLIKR